MEKKARPKREGLRKASYHDNPGVFEWEDMNTSVNKSKPSVPRPAPSPSPVTSGTAQATSRTALSRQDKSAVPSVPISAPTQVIKSALPSISATFSSIQPVFPTRLPVVNKSKLPVRKVAFQSATIGTDRSAIPPAFKSATSAGSAGTSESRLKTVKSALPSTSAASTITQRESVAFGSYSDERDSEDDIKMHDSTGFAHEEDIHDPDQLLPRAVSYSGSSDLDSDVEFDASDSSGDDSCCSSDSEHDDESNDAAWVAGRETKFNLWGLSNKDWTKPTDLDQWIRTKDGLQGEDYLADLTAKVGMGSVSLEELEQDLPPEHITMFWWSLKPALERCRNQMVTAIIGHCPQYAAAFCSDPKNQPPETSPTLTNAIITAVANIMTLPCLFWDIRPDCRKTKPKNGGKYAGCRSLEAIELRHCLRLNELLVKMAESFYGIRIASTLSFSSSGNMFVGTLQGKHVILSKHISRMRDDRSLAILMCQRMAEAGLTNLTTTAAYDMLASYLCRAPGIEAGRRRVLLPALDKIASSFSEQVADLDGLLSRLRLEAQEYRDRPENKARKRELRQRPEYRARERELAQRPEQKTRRKGWKQQPKYKAQQIEYQKKPETKARHKELRNSTEAKAKRTAKRHAKRTSHGRSTKSEREEICRMALANTDWSADQLVTWASDTFGLVVKAHTIKGWIRSASKGLDAHEGDGTDEDDDGMEMDGTDEIDEIQS